MTEHYFSGRPQAPSDPAEFSVVLRGREFRFRTDASVFSKDRVDFGSNLLIDTVPFQSDDIVLDLGCGYGPIGLVAAAFVPRGRTYLVDVNERAIGLAQYNLEHNGLVGRAEVRMGDGTAPVQGIAFTKVLMNPPVRAGKAVIYRLVDEAYAILAPGGSLWVVIQNKQGAPSMAEKLRATFGSCRDMARKAGYRILTAIRQ